MKVLVISFLGLALLAGCRKRPSQPSSDSSGSAPAPAPAAAEAQPTTAAAPAPPAPGSPEAAPGAPEEPAPPAAASGEVMDLSTVRNALDSYVKKTGKVPDDLSELVKAGYLRALPLAPTGYRLFYDPITVTVSMPKKW